MKTTMPIIVAAFLLFPQAASAQAITLRYRHFLFPITATAVENFAGEEKTWQWQNMTMRPPQEFRVDGDKMPALPAGIVASTRTIADPARIAATLRAVISPELDRETGNVTIGRDAAGKVTFDGIGLTGLTVDVEASAALIAQALKEGITDIELVVRETQPTITVSDAGLRDMGIKEVVTVGESDMSNSPKNRQHNIETGLSKFNGHIIPKDTIFSFGETIGPVDGSAGYLKELVIKGDKTVPDYGGGLCQVSTTAYRGIWEYGFPIVQRINHSYSVSHYFPQGTDATVYPPNVDIKFRNDSPGALLMQTHRNGDFVYFIYYGTKDNRKTSVVGPFIWDRVSPPAQKTEYTMDLPVGEKRKVGEAVPGLKTAWYRFVSMGTGSTMETVLSHYQARPLFYQIGGADPSTADSLIPDWIEAVDPSA